MQKFLALALLLGCQATEPRLLQQATTTPPVTTTPGPTTTTTPGFTNQISYNVGTPSGGGRRLSAVTRSQLLLATCKAFAGLTAACSASIPLNPVASASGMIWPITAYLTTTAANAATQSAALNAYKSSPTSLGSAMTAALATVGATATVTVSSVAVTEVAARPFVPSPPAAAMPDKPFIFQVPVSGGTALSRWQANQTGTYNLALAEALVQIGFPNGYVGAEFVGEGATWQANVTVYPPLSAVNSSATVLQYMIYNPATLGTVFTEKVQAKLPEWKTAAATITFSAPQITPFQLPTQVQGVLGTVVTINANTPENTTYTGVADTDPNTYGVLYDADDDSEDKEETAAKYSSAAWTLPLAGVFGLFLLMSFIGARHNRKRSTRQFEHLAQTETEHLVNQEEGVALE